MSVWINTEIQEVLCTAIYLRWVFYVLMPKSALFVKEYLGFSGVCDV